VRRERIDLVVVNGWFEPVSWLLAAAKDVLGVRVAMIGDPADPESPRRRPVERMKRAFLRRMDAVLTAGTRQSSYLVRLGMPADRIALGCDVVDNARFAGGERSDALPPQGGCRAGDPGPPVTIGTAARLIPAKNLENAIAAVARVAADPLVPPFRWRIAGAGPLDASLRRCAVRLDAPVEFVGGLAYDSMPGFYREVHCYWQPSLSESWGLAINEAMASALPVLSSTRCGCVPDLVRAANGWTHEPDPAGLERGLRTALANVNRWAAMGAESQSLIADWGPERFADGLRLATEAAIGRRAPSAAARGPERLAS
jgi:glycosyltransferase involved in cell wall biosynthesis